MGIFKKKNPDENNNWVDDIELFANYYGDLKTDLQQLTSMAMMGEYELAEYFWDRWDDHAKGCAFFYVLGALEGAFEEISHLYECEDDDDY